MRKFLLSAFAVVGLGVASAWAAGLFPGLPTVFPAGSGGNQTVNGVSLPAGAYNVLPLTGNELVPADTELASGQTPQSEAISVAQLKLFANTPVVLTSASPLAIDGSLGDLYTVTLTGNTTLGTPTNLVPGKKFQIEFTQDSTGSRTLACSQSSAGLGTSCALWKFPGGVTISNLGLTTAAGAHDLLTGVYDGTNILASTQDNFK